jgi:FMN-dependent NADH-azoreductase
MTDQMNILVVNGSPRGEQGNTAILTRAFLEGATEAGARSETVYLKDKKINYCTGCYSCWLKTPGVCIHKDDMPELLEKIQQANVVVYATPLYIYTVTGLMKVFLDRIIPLVEPFIEVKDGVCSHPSRYEITRPTASVLISNCGFPEQDHFASLRMMFRQLFRQSERMTLAGMICCSGGGMLNDPNLQDMLKWYIDAVRQAGREIVGDLHISDATQAIVDRPLTEDVQAWAAGANAFFASFGVTPRKA